MLRFADFCAGIGGFRLGLEKIGWQCVYSCEIDQNCAKTYELNFAQPLDAKDIFEVDIADLPTFDVLCAGFPCQPFSIAGKQLGFADGRSQVLLQLLKIIEVKKPSVIILENVPNFVSHAAGKTFSYLVSELNKLNYDFHYEFLDAANFGVPQHRKRLFVVAFRKDIAGLFFSITKVRYAITPFRPFIAHNDYTIPISSKWQDYLDLYTGKKNLTNLKFAVPKTRTSLESVSRGVQLNDCVLQIRSSGIRAYSIDAPLPTFAVSHSGGGAMIPVLTKERRHLNVTEIKRIMGFPDDFKFNVSRTHAIKELSNAVCPPVVTSLGSDIQALLEA